MSEMQFIQQASCQIVKAADRKPQEENNDVPSDQEISEPTDADSEVRAKGPNSG
jgi:hypothetical protein